MGIGLTTDGVPGSFAAFGLAPHDLPEGRYFSSITFADPKVQTSKTVFSGVPVGQTPLLASGTYTPVLALANFSSSPRQVTVHYALSQNGAPSVSTVAAVTLAPSSTQEITLSGLLGDPLLQDSFIEEDDGNPGDVQAKLMSKISSPLSEIELIGKDFNDPENGGDHPWTVENGTTSTLLLFNQSDQVQSFNVEISAGGTRTVAEILLSASLATNAPFTIFIAGLLRKVMNDMDESAFTKFLTSFVRHSKRSLFVNLVFSVPLLEAMPYFYFAVLQSLDHGP